MPLRKTFPSEPSDLIFFNVRSISLGTGTTFTFCAYNISNMVVPPPLLLSFRTLGSVNAKT